MPINLATICEYFGKWMHPTRRAPWWRSRPTEFDAPTAANLDEKGIS